MPGDICLAGVCTNRCINVTCPVPDQCHFPGGCYNGICLAQQAKTDLTPCNDGSDATQNDVCISGVCQGQLVPPNATFFWQFDEGTGDVVSDSANPGFNGVFHNAVDSSWIRGAIDAGFALSLNQFGLTQQFVSFTNPPHILSTNFSISFWAQPAATMALPSQQSNSAPLDPSGLQIAIASVDGSAIGGQPGAYGVEIAVGINGIVVLESRSNACPLLVWSGSIIT